MKIGRCLLALTLAYAGIKLSGGASAIKYEAQCTQANSEYLDVEVINKDTTTLPSQVETEEGCVLPVSFNADSRHFYYTLNNQERSQFRIKARKDGDYTSIYEIYLNDNEHLTTRTVSMNKQMFEATDNAKCFAPPEGEVYCFSKEVKLELPSNRLFTLDITVDSDNHIVSYEQI